MKYPKPWEAGMPAGKPYVASSREGSHEGKIQLATYVNRPGTPDHARLVRTWLSLAEAERLRDELTHHINLVGHCAKPTQLPVVPANREVRDGDIH